MGVYWGARAEGVHWGARALGVYWGPLVRGALGVGFHRVISPLSLRSGPLPSLLP